MTPGPGPCGPGFDYATGWYEATNAHFHRDYYKRPLQATKSGRSPENDKVSTFTSFPTILLDGWEGPKAYTLKKDSLKVHTLKKISAAKLLP